MGGYKNLLIYRLAKTTLDFNFIFIERWIDKKTRTYDQMYQAARSGKQNIAEGSKEISSSSELLLNSVSRSSYTELIEDYEDFLRLRKLQVWKKEDPRVIKIRTFQEKTDKDTNLTDLASWTQLNLNILENFANMMICLCYKQGYLIDQFLRSKQEKFVKEGGFRENMFRKRREFQKRLVR